MLSGENKKYLRKLSMNYRSIIQVGKDGISENLILRESALCANPYKSLENSYPNCRVSLSLFLPIPRYIVKKKPLTLRYEKDFVLYHLSNHLNDVSDILRHCRCNDRNNRC